MIRIAFTGHRPPSFGGYDETLPLIVGVQRALRRLVSIFSARYPEGVTFCSGMALGFDTWAAEAVLATRAAGRQVRLTAVVPFAGQASRWPARSQARYLKILAAADEVITLVQPEGTPTAEQVRGWLLARNCWLVDHADLVVGIWDGRAGGTAHCLAYAASHGVRRIVATPAGYATWPDEASAILRTLDAVTEP